MIWVPNISIIIIGWVLQTLIIMGFIWFKKYKILDESYNCWLLTGLRGLLFTIFAVFALIFFDSNIKILFFGVEGYVNISLHLTSIILTFIIAIQIMIGILLVKPNLKGIISFLALFITFVTLWDYYFNIMDLSKFNLFDSKYSVFLVGIVFPILVGVITSIILTIVEFFIKRKKLNLRIIDIVFWDKQIIVKKIFNIRFNIILWFLITIELILNLQGLSILLWLTVFF